MRARAAQDAASASWPVLSRERLRCCAPSQASAGRSRDHQCRRRRELPMRKQLMKGNEAIVKSAILAGCRAFYGYPITPASEIAEAAAEYMPRAGGVFRAGRERSGGHQYVVRRRVGGRALHDGLQRPRHQPDAGRHQLHGRRGTALRDRRHHARRPGPGQHRQPSRATTTRW